MTMIILPVGTHSDMNSHYCCPVALTCSDGGFFTLWLDPREKSDDSNFYQVFHQYAAIPDEFILIPGLYVSRGFDHYFLGMK